MAFLIHRFFTAKECSYQNLKACLDQVFIQEDRYACPIRTDRRKMCVTQNPEQLSGSRILKSVSANYTPLHLYHITRKRLAVTVQMPFRSSGSVIYGWFRRCAGCMSSVATTELVQQLIFRPMVRQKFLFPDSAAVRGGRGAGLTGHRRVSSVHLGPSTFVSTSYTVR
jgi:hypothetical protein